MKYLCIIFKTCKLLRALPPASTGAPPLDPAGELPSSRPYIPHPWKKILRVPMPLNVSADFHSLNSMFVAITAVAKFRQSYSPGYFRRRC